MKVYQFTIPQNKVDLWFETALAKGWGGFTRHVAVGAWKNPDGKVEIEHIYVYTVGVEEGNDRGWALREWVCDYLRASKEQAAFFAEVGQAEIVYL